MIMKMKDIIAMSSDELNKKVIELKQELAKERATIASGTRSENPGKIRKIRRDTARVLTAIKQKEGKVKNARV